MEYTAELNFTRSLLSAMHISSTILTEPEICISSSVDLGLRSLLYDTDNYISILENSLNAASNNVIYRFVDEYDCKYVFMRLPDGTYFFIGPFLLSLPDRDFIEKKASRLSLTEAKIKQLMIYYADLPVIEDENWLLTLANTLGTRIWGSKDQYIMEYIEYEIRDHSTPIPVSAVNGDPYDAPLSLSVLEANYENEKILMKAVSEGKLHLLTSVASSVFNNGTEPRHPDSLRNRKNYLIILKTLLRKAAEYGGVHPLHIHRLSSAYAQHIEQARTIRESLQVQEDMIRDYCLLVKNHSLKQYSYYVGKAITLIHYDVTADLSLSTIAEQINVNSSYLSKLFRKECGCTLTEYVHRKRMERSLILLRDERKRIQDIAEECGFQDTTYFIRVFKKQYGTTPSVYREENF
ncbi:MAG: helix-turn-helix domain-containing protein [Firmicutes bacterium]|nr:helix-turn-helix domain-containing protein [Bacillota bacterium]